MSRTRDTLFLGQKNNLRIFKKNYFILLCLDGLCKQRNGDAMNVNFFLNTKIFIKDIMSIIEKHVTVDQYLCIYEGLEKYTSNINQQKVNEDDQG